MLSISAIVALVRRKVVSMAIAIADSKAESCTTSTPSNIAFRAILKKARLGLLTETAIFRKAGEDVDKTLGTVEVAAAAAAEVVAKAGGGRDMPVV